MHRDTKLDTDLYSMADEELSAEHKRLEAQKLRLEVRELDVVYWKRPAWLASVATIAAAAIGLAWAVINGYFETRIRELRLETRDLMAGRDRQTKHFLTEKATYESKIEVLQSRAATLEQRVANLDRPIISHVYIHNAPWDSPLTRPSRTAAELYLRGANFGADMGTLTLTIVVTSSGSTVSHGDAGVTLRPQQWTHEEIRASFTGLTKSTLQKILSRYTKRPGSELNLVFVLSVRRADGVTFPARSVAIDGGAIEWALSP